MELRGWGGHVLLVLQAGLPALCLLCLLKLSAGRRGSSADSRQPMKTSSRSLPASQGRRRRSQHRFLPVKTCKSNSRRGAAACSPCFFIESIKHYGQRAFCSAFAAAARAASVPLPGLFNIPLLLLYPDFKHIIRLLTGLHIAALYSKAL